MFLNNGDNNGNQYNAEHDININYNGNQRIPNVDLNKICKVKTSFSMVSRILLGTISVIADLITIWSVISSFMSSNIKNVIEYLKTNETILSIELLLIIILIMISWSIWDTIYQLTRKNKIGKLIRRGQRVYKMIPLMCPICGETTHGKLLIKHNTNDDVDYFECNKNPSHRWLYDHTTVL